MSYAGGKGASGVAQKIISLMPPHAAYAELFAGAATIFRTKRPAHYNFAGDSDEKVVRRIIAPSGPQKFQIECCNAFDWLQQRVDWYKNLLIYLDPPYLPATLHQQNGRGRQRYDHKFSVECHEKLLSVITTLKCYVMISGYDSSMYNRVLCAPAWTKKTFMAQTRNGMREECVWMNFDPNIIPTRHDYRFIGENFRERERIQKMQRRWLRKFKTLAPVERNAMLQMLSEKNDVNSKNQNE